MASKPKKKAKGKSNAKKPTKNKPTIKALVLEIMSKNGKASTQDIIKQVKAKFKDSAFSKSHVAYYRNLFRKDPYNLDIPKLRESGGKKKTAKGKTKTKAKAKKKKKKKTS